MSKVLDVTRSAMRAQDDPQIGGVRSGEQHEADRSLVTADGLCD